MGAKKLMNIFLVWQKKPQCQSKVKLSCLDWYILRDYYDLRNTNHTNLEI